MKAKLKTTPVSENRHIRAFFDAIAENYQEAHGQSLRLLTYRLSIIRQLLGNNRGTLLEIGCGTGVHLFHLAEFYEHAIGTDLSQQMIKVAQRLSDSHLRKDTLSFRTDPAEQLSSIEDQQIDTVLCVGAFEHMRDKQNVLRQVKRVLKDGGEFICLTPNGGYCWYRNISHWLNCDTKHLSSDHFLTKQEISKALDTAELTTEQTGWWTFIPKGDVPLVVFLILNTLDYIGSLLNISAFRGGLYFKAVNYLYQNNSLKLKIHDTQ